METMAKISSQLDLTVPTQGLRRLRQNSHIRELVQENRVSHRQLIQPLFVVEGLKSKEVIPGLTGVYRETSTSLLKQIESDLESGVSKFILFGVPKNKKEKGFKFDFTSNQIKAIKSRFGSSVWLAADVCLCSSTITGQCGVIGHEGRHKIPVVANAPTVKYLAQAATQYALAGADCVAPSDMMDGRVGAIRQSLARAGLEHTVLMSYSAKFHSKFYGPFRVAADSAPRAGAKASGIKDRSTYQIEPSRLQDAYLSSVRDANEGADILMVKPGLPYLDVLAKLSLEIPLPWAVYEVSGEYAALELLAKEGLADGPAAHCESWTAPVYR